MYRSKGNDEATEKTFSVDLSEFGDCGGEPFYVKLLNPRLLTYGERYDITEKVNAVTEENEKAEFKGRRLLGAYIVATNLTDPEKPDTDEPLDLNDPDLYSKLPAQIADKISEALFPKKDKARKNL